MPGVAAATQIMHFDLAGISVSAGAACSSGSMRQSHVLRAMGVAADAANEVIRASLAPSTTAAEIDGFLAAWRALRDRAGHKAASAARATPFIPLFRPPTRKRAVSGKGGAVRLGYGGRRTLKQQQKRNKECM